MKLFPKNVYTYKDNNNIEKLCVYVCDTDNSNEIIVGLIEDIDPLNSDFIRMSNGLKKVLYLDRFLTLKIDKILKPFYLNHQLLTITSVEFQKLTLAIYKMSLLRYEKMVENFAHNNFDSETLKDITLPEKIIKLLTWNLKKFDLRFNEFNENLIIMEHCVYFAYFGTNIGSEMEKLRPVIVWKKHENKDNHSDDMYYVFPISSKVMKKKYNHNVDILLNGCLNKVLINHGKLISRKRFDKIYKDKNTGGVIKIDKKTKERIKNAIKIYFKV